MSREQQQHYGPYPCSQAGAIAQVTDSIRRIEERVGDFRETQVRVLDEVGLSEKSNGHSLRGRVASMELAVEQINEYISAQKTIRQTLEDIEEKREEKETSRQTRVDRKLNRMFGLLGAAVALIAIWQFVGPLVRPVAPDAGTTRQIVQQAVQDALRAADEPQSGNAGGTR